MPKMTGKASEITDSAHLLRRIAYRNERLLMRISTRDDPVAYVKIMAGHNRTELRRLAELLGVALDEVGAVPTVPSG